MADYLTRSLRSYLETTGTKVVDLEKAAAVPASSVGNILRGFRPRPERLGEILRVIPNPHASDILRAYLMDDIPPDFRHAVTILIQEFSSLLQEPQANPPKDRLTSCLDRLTAACQGDDSLAEWLINTVDLMLPRSP